MELTPITLSEANAFVREHHRHHGQVVGARMAVAVSADGEVLGVGIAGRPVARGLDDGFTMEVTRVCAREGIRNACSMLYGALARAAFALGYRRIVTYILDNESGVSLSAAGWKIAAEVKGRTWSCPSRPRVDKHPLQGKIRFERHLVGAVNIAGQGPSTACPASEEVADPKGER